MAYYHRPELMELSLVARAVRNRWPIPEEVRQKLPERMRELLEHGDYRQQVAAARVLIEADKLNLQDEQLESLRKIQADQEALNAALGVKSAEGTGTAETGDIPPDPNHITTGAKPS